MPLVAGCLLTQNKPMTIARSQLIDRERGGFHHIVSRCVRRAWLCGRDSLTGRDYSHRRGWIEKRLLLLTKAFSVQAYGYALMSNHCHLVVEYRPQDAKKWTNEEVARRWLLVHPPRASKNPEARVEALASDEERIEVVRDRLADLSWFMRSLNWWISRRANREDDCTGRFWEGRFHSSKPLPNMEAVRACMGYVDLNPLRAGATSSVSGGTTGLARRVEEAGVEPEKATRPLAPLTMESNRICSGGPTSLEVTLTTHLESVSWIAWREGLVESPLVHKPEGLADPDEFLACVSKYRKRWGRKEGRGDLPVPGHVPLRQRKEAISLPA